MLLAECNDFDRALFGFVFSHRATPYMVSNAAVCAVQFLFVAPVMPHIWRLGA